MTKPDIIHNTYRIHMGGHAYRWQEICDPRRWQLAALKAARAEQPPSAVALKQQGTRF
jgi:hypothetical protein